MAVRAGFHYLKASGQSSQDLHLRYRDFTLSFRHRYGIECKRADAPTMTPSMRIALKDLKLERIVVIYPGKQRYSLHKQVEVVPLDMQTGSDETSIFKSGFPRRRE